MPVLIPHFPPQAAEIRPFWELEESAVAQGLEGQQVREQIEIVGKHWREQSLDALVASDTDLLDELSDYRHPPFEKVGTRLVRYVRITDLQPRKIDFDEDGL
jgi:hypothetical protein